MRGASVASPDPSLSAVTVREALRLPALRQGMPEVVAGHDQLDRVVRWVHAGEVSNIATLLTGGEMLLTTGMGAGTSRAAQRSFVERLAERRIAALVIELGGAFTEVPAAMSDAAGAAGLPLIVLHREIPFVAVTEALHTEIVGSHYALLRRGEEIHRELSGLMLDGDGIPEVLAALARVLGAPVYLEGRGELLAHATPAGYDLDPLAVWESAREAVDDVAVRAAPVRMGADHAGGRLLAADLQSGDALAQVALGHAAEVLALALLRDRQEEELVTRGRETFLTSLVDGRIPPGAVARAAQAAGLGREPKLLLPVAAMVRASAAPASGEWSVALREVQRSLRERGLSAILGRRDGHATVLALVALREPEQAASAADAVAAALRHEHRERLGAEATSVAVGRVSAPEACGPELALTAESAASAVVLGDERPWRDVSTLELQRLLWARRDDADLSAFVERVAGPLLEHDRQRSRALLPTLEALLDHRGHKAQTARALHLNRQALYYRLARIEELLGVDLGDPQQTLALHVALKARRILEGERPGR